MKTIIYILTAIMISGILFSTIPLKPLNAQECVILKCTDDNANADLMKKSANIMEHRLQTLDIQTVTVNIDGKESQIGICLKSVGDAEKASEVLSSQGKFEFYETGNRNDVISLLKKNDKLFSVLNINESSKENVSVLGFCKEEMKAEAEKYLQSIKNKTDGKLKFVWSKFKGEEEKVYLYILKSEASFCGDKITNAESKFDDYSGEHTVLMELDDSGTKLFADITKKNIGKAVAMVMDDEVYSAPRVMAEIKGGRMMISGNFSGDETSAIAALIKNGELPLEFKIVK